MHICVTEETNWIGGQFTAQALGMPDDNPWVEDVGAAKSYTDLMQAVQAKTGAAPLSRGPGFPQGNDMGAPPNVWHDAMTDLVAPYLTAITGAKITIETQMKPVSVVVDTSGAHPRVTGVNFTYNGTTAVTRSARIILDATDLGDLLPLAADAAGLKRADVYRLGQEATSDTGELRTSPSPITGACRECVQALTWDVAVEMCPEAKANAATKPGLPDAYGDPLDATADDYWTSKSSFGKYTEGTVTHRAANYSHLGYRRVLRGDYSGKGTVGSKCATASADGGRRGMGQPISGTSLDGAVLGDITILNLENDFPWGNIVEPSSDPDILAKLHTTATGEALVSLIKSRAKARTLAYVYWLQHDAPRDPVDGTNPVTGTMSGYPTIILRGDLTGNPSGPDEGLAQYPYIREGRRLKAQTTIRIDDIDQPDVPILGSQNGRNQFQMRGQEYNDSVGIGYYAIDVHTVDAYATGAPCGGDNLLANPKGCSAAANPNFPAPRPAAHHYQVPLGALVPVELDGLLAAGKALGTTHWSNAAYRLHPTEWAIGEAAGIAAARFLISVDTGKYASPTALYRGSDEKSRQEAYTGDPTMIYPSTDLESYVRAVQNDVVLGGAPIYWADDVGVRYGGTTTYVSGVPNGQRPGKITRGRPWADMQLVAGAHILPARGGQPRGSLMWYPAVPQGPSDFARGMQRAFDVALPVVPKTGLSRKKLASLVSMWGTYTYPGADCPVATRQDGASALAAGLRGRFKLRSNPAVSNAPTPKIKVSSSGGTCQFNGNCAYSSAQLDGTGSVDPIDPTGQSLIYQWSCSAGGVDTDCSLSSNGLAPKVQLLDYYPYMTPCSVALGIPTVSLRLENDQDAVCATQTLSLQCN